MHDNTLENRSKDANKRTRNAGRRPRRRLSAADRRKAILKTAKAVFLSEGYERTTMRKIAARLRITPTTLYLHFPDKESLLREISNESFALLETALQEVMETHENSLDALSRMLDAYVQFGLSHPQEYRFLLMTEKPKKAPPQRLDPNAFIEGEDRGMRSLALLEKQIGRLMDLGHIRRDKPAVVAEAVWAAAHGLVALLITIPDFPWSERLSRTEAMRTMILSGVAGSSAR